MSFASRFIKDTFKAPLDRIVDNFAQNVAAGVASAVVPSNTQRTGTDLVSAGLAVNNAQAETAARTDAAIIGAENDYASIRGKDTARVAASDIAAQRVPELSGNFENVVVPQKKIDSVNKNANDNVYLLTDMNHGPQPYMRILFGEYKRPNPLKPANIDTKFTAFLPLPIELNESNQIRYSPDELDTVGDIANVIGAGGTGAGGAAAATLLRNTDNIVSTFGGVLAKAVPNALVAAAGSAMSSGSKNIASVLEQSLGVAPNPNPSMSFKGPTLRSYSFSWLFHPNNPDESERIRKFVREVKKRALPSPTISENTALLNYPQMCQINLFPWDQNGTGPWYWSADSFLKYKKSVITTVNVNYAPNGIPSFFAGTKLPVFIAMTISFAEIEFFTSDDWAMTENSKLIPTDQIGKRLKDEDAVKYVTNLSGEQAAQPGTVPETPPAQASSAPMDPVWFNALR